MSLRQSKLEAERLAILNQSTARGRSTSPGRHGEGGGSNSPSRSDQDLKWSITNHDPLERLDQSGEDFEAEVSEEEHISDDDDNEKFQYDDTGNILPNYACGDEKIDEVSHILEKSNLNDRETVKRLEELTAGERALANAHKVGATIDEDVMKRLAEDKQQLTGFDTLDLLKLDQDANSRRHKLETYSSYRKKIIEKEAAGNAPSSNPTTSSTGAPVLDLATSASPSASTSTSTSSASASAAAAAVSPPPASGDESTIESDSTALPGGNTSGEFMVPYTSAVEDKLDSEFAYQLNETIKEGEIDSNRAQSRVIQTITRGNFFQLIDPTIKPKMFLVCMDFSPESIFALEWCLGTVLVDGSVLFIVCVIEENDANHHLKSNSVSESQREQIRMNMLNKAKQQVLNLLKLTKLQIHIVIEIIHHPIPRHLILEFIDNLQPTLVVVGSKGQSAIKGVLLGSLSNYLVTKSSVPVMVVREKLKKINRFKNGSTLFSNNIKPLTLSEARVD